MFIDSVLRLVGENPAGYYETQDKWIAIIAFLIDYDHFFMPWILGAIPIIWLIIRKKRKKKITATMVVITAIATIGLGVFGFVILDWLADLAFGFAYQRMYGDIFK